MEENEENRSKYLKIRLRPSEEATLQKQYKRSTFQNLSEYGRAMVLGEPVTIILRDKSMDDMLEELAQLRRELNYIGNNLNQAMKQINSAHGFPDTRLWMNLMTIIKGKLEPSVSKIKERMDKYADLWSQKLKVVKA